GQPDGDVVGEQRAEGEDLAEAPVDVALDGHLGAPVEQLLDALVRRESGGQVDVRLADALDQCRVDRRAHYRIRLDHPAAGRLHRTGRVPGRLEHRLELLLEVTQRLL